MASASRADTRLERSNLPQAHAIHIFHQQVINPVRLAELEQRHDIGMQQLGQRLRFPGEPFGKRGVAADARRQHFQRDDAVELFLARLIDRAHAALADEFGDLQLRERGGQPFERGRFRPLAAGWAGVRGDCRRRHEAFGANPLRRVRRDGRAATGTSSMLCRTIHTCL